MTPILRLASLVTTAFLAAASSACSTESRTAEGPTVPNENHGIVAGTLEATAALQLTRKRAFCLDSKVAAFS